jgi:hypothetical protein
VRQYWQRRAARSISLPNSRHEQDSRERSYLYGR